MNPTKRLVHVQWKDFQLIRDVQDQLKKTCRLHQVSYQYVDMKSSSNILINEVMEADYCVIWHGTTPISSWAVDTRKRLGKHYCVLEMGWFPQGEYWHIDSEGLCGKSSLCGEIREPTQRDLQMLQNRREEYRASYSPVFSHQFNLPDDYVLVPLQLERDSTIYMDAPYKKVSDFIHHVLNQFPDRPVVIKTHPKSPSTLVNTRGREDVFVVREGLFTDFVPKASLVYGQTSTCLLESALLGKETVVIGDCPLAHHMDETEKLLAVMCGQQIERNLSADMWWHIIGQEVPPKGNKKDREKTVTVITPSRDRPSIRLLEKWVRRQSLSPCWIVAEDGMKSDVSPDHHIVSEYAGSALESFRFNLIRGLEQAAQVDNEFFVIMEDDVWYSPKFLETYINKMVEQDLEMTGAKRCLTYSLHHGWVLKEGKEHSSLCATVFHKSLIPHLMTLVKNSDSPSFDVKSWKSFGVGKKRFDFHLHWNLKDLPGTGGFVGHNTNNENSRRNYAYQPDPDHRLLKEVLGDDADDYLSFL